MKTWRLLKAHLVTAGLASIITATVVAVGVGAAVPDAGGTIHACMKTVKGTLRIIDTESGDTCLQSETPVSWPGSQTGSSETEAFALITTGQSSSGEVARVDASRSSGITESMVSLTSSSQAGNRAFCIDNLGFAVKNVQLTASSPANSIVAASLGSNGCDVYVSLFNTVTQRTESGDFFITLRG